MSGRVLEFSPDRKGPAVVLQDRRVDLLNESLWNVSRIVRNGSISDEAADRLRSVIWKRLEALGA
jgi:hypothetical protein